MPIIVKDRLCFYQLPVEYHAHTPKTLTSVLSFAVKELDQEKWRSTLQDNGLAYEQPFGGPKEYHEFIRLFMDILYDEQEHLKAADTVRKYFSRFTGEELFFDIGYSGRIQAAISEAIGKADGSAVSSRGL